MKELPNRIQIPYVDESSNYIHFDILQRIRPLTIHHGMEYPDVNCMERFNSCCLLNAYTSDTNIVCLLHYDSAQLVTFALN